MKNKLLSLFFLLGLPGGLLAQKVIYFDTVLPEKYEIYSLSVVDEQIAWIVANPRESVSIEPQIKVLRTLDGGTSWQVLDVLEKGRWGIDIVGRSASEAWITTTGTVNDKRVRGIFKTSNGGKSWSSVLDHRAGCCVLRIYDEQHIQGLSSNSFISGYSSDGGLTWAMSALQPHEREALMIGRGNRMACVIGDTLWAGTVLGRIIRCTNYGENCNFLSYNGLPDSIGCYSLTFTDHLSGLLFFYTNKMVGKFAKTTDGGLTWKILEGIPEILSNSWLAPAPGGRGAFWALSTTGSISTLGYTSDFGQSWDLQSFPGVWLNMQCGPERTPWIILQENVRKAMENYLLILYNRYRLEGIPHAYSSIANIFINSEELHAISLLRAKRSAEAMHQSELPLEIIQQEKELRGSIDQLEKQRIRLEKNATDQAISIQIKTIQQQYDDLIQQIETTYPNFLRNRNDVRVAHLHEMQQAVLQPGQVLIQYYILDSIILIGLLDRNKLQYFHVKKDFPLEQWVTDLRSSLTAFQTDPAMANSYDSLAAAYTRVAYRLYEKLLAPFTDSLPKHLIIMPDGALSYLPFEALLTALPTTAPTRWQEQPYLIKQHSISYIYSATMLREMTVHPHRHEPTVNFYGFAPRYDGSTALLDSIFDGINLRKDLQPLPYTGEEVYKAAKLMDGAYFTGSEASEANFRAKASEARILHLATHGRANSKTGDYSFLVFAEQKDGLENEILYARDIYNLQLNADLVTLSACETGLGELQENEGVISLARAFAYAGAKSIVTSLWSVSDAKTKDLMVDFYKNLRKGMLKDDALRQAKLDFLKHNKGQAAHPFYWAGFVGIGNMGKVK